MWYFTWVLGLGLAVAFGVLNGLWHEFRSDGEAELLVVPANGPGSASASHTATIR